MAAQCDHITDEQISRADRKHRANMRNAAQLLNVTLGSMWPCGHHRNPLTTQVVGAIARCRTCRRRRIRDFVHREAARRKLNQAVKRRVGRDAHEAWERNFEENMPIGKALVWRVADAFHIEPEELISQNRVRELVRPRHMACKLLSDLTLPCGASRFSYPQIGKLLNGRDHSTVINGKKKCEIICEREPEYARIYMRLRDELVQGGFIVEARHG